MQNKEIKNVYVDIDETICTTPNSRDYNLSEPIVENIKKINHLYEQGHKITYWTARGTLTGIDWRELTEKQFQTWGVKYHDLKFKKPAYDIFICDKAMNSTSFFENGDITRSNS